MLLSEKLLEVRIEIHGACLVASAQKAVQGPRHLMFDFVAEAEQKSKVVRGMAVHWACGIDEAPLKLPILVSTAFGLVVSLPFRTLGEVPVVDALGAVVGM